MAEINEFVFKFSILEFAMIKKFLLRSHCKTPETNLQ